MQKTKIELLSPCGSENAVIAAVNGGCDAVYLGGRNFNARGSADNFDEAGLKHAIDYCHLRGVKVYITLNTLYRNAELIEVTRFAAMLRAMGADAFIMQDIGVFSYLKKQLPGAIFHASTQMTAHSLNDVRFLENAGFSRIVLSRELSLSEIEHISKNSDTELEAFVHGALCVCYSGICLMSSFIGGRSGNRGQCAQPCRLRYSLEQDGKTVCDESHLLSPKDLMTIDILGKITSCGVKSLKIEGRLKSPEYVGAVTEAYRAALDSMERGSAFNADSYKKRMTGIFNRGGFTQGYYERHSGQDMMSNETPKHMGVYAGAVGEYDKKSRRCVFVTKTNLIPGDGIEIRSRGGSTGTLINRSYSANDRVSVELTGNIMRGDRVYKSFDKAAADYAKKLYQGDTRKLDILCGYTCKIGEPFSVTLSYNGISVTESGETAQSAEKQALSDERIEEQLKKSGSYPFSVTFSGGVNDNASYLNISDINEVRRRACTRLAEKITASAEHKNNAVPYSPKQAEALNNPKTVSALVSGKAQLNALLNIDGLSRIYAETDSFSPEELISFSRKCTENKKEFFAALPHINRLDISEALEFLEKTDISGYLARTAGQLELLKTSTKKIALDQTLNVSNELSNDFFLEITDTVMPSLELSSGELLFTRPENELLIYGRTAVMTTALCPVGIYAGEKDAGRHCRYKDSAHGFSLRDRKGASLPLRTVCGECYAQILSDRPIFMLNRLGMLEGLFAGAYRLDFSNEPGETAAALVECAVDSLKNGKYTPGEAVIELQERGVTHGRYKPIE